jgi:hypothetical protein
MSRDEKKKGKLLDIEDNDLQRALFSAPNLHIENVEDPNDDCVAEIDPELHDSSHVQMAAPLVEQVRLHFHTPIISGLKDTPKWLFAGFISGLL